MILCYSGVSRISAQKIASASGGRITLNRGKTGDANWGRSGANTELNPKTYNATDKYRMKRIFQDQEIPSPRLFSIVEARTHIVEGGKVVGRPDRHTKGRGYWLCATQGDIDRALVGTRRKSPATHFTEYIPFDREYRVHVFNGKSIRISEKDFGSPIISSIRSRGNRFKVEVAFSMRKPTHPVRRIRRAAKAAVKALGLDFGAVDVLEKDGRAYVLEVNSAPGLGGSTPALYADAFLRWYDERA